MGWLRAYTAGAAYAGVQEHERGTITPGKRADLLSSRATSTRRIPHESSRRGLVEGSSMTPDVTRLDSESIDSHLRDAGRWCAVALLGPVR